MLLCSVGDVARMLGVPPAQVSQLFYERHVRDDLAPIVAGRRIIGADAIPVIAAALNRRGAKVDPVVLRQVGSIFPARKATPSSCEPGLAMMTQGGEL